MAFSSVSSNRMRKSKRKQKEAPATRKRNNWFRQFVYELQLQTTIYCYICYVCLYLYSGNRIGIINIQISTTHIYSCFLILYLIFKNRLFYICQNAMPLSFIQKNILKLLFFSYFSCQSQQPPTH